MPIVNKKRVSIYTISKELGVSAGTVSRALNNHPSVSAEIRAKVKPLAEKYNFKPRVVSSKTTNICILVQKWTGHPLGLDEYITMTMVGVAEYCHDEKLEISLYGADAEELNKSDTVRELRRRGIDGVIIFRATDESHYLEQMEQQRFPYFNLFDHNQINSSKALVLDNEMIGYEATRHLISLGHRTIGVIRDSLHLSSINDRYSGYVKAFREAGLEPDPRLVFIPDPVPSTFCSTWQLGQRGIETLLARVPEMTAVFTTDDKIAHGALNYLNKNNISIPEQLSVVGVSDYPDAEFYSPSLTTVRIPYKEFGYEGARQIHRLCRGLDVCIKDTTLESFIPKLIVRDTTGPNSK